MRALVVHTPRSFPCKCIYIKKFGLWIVLQHYSRDDSNNEPTNNNSQEIIIKDKIIKEKIIKEKRGVISTSTQITNTNSTKKKKALWRSKSLPTRDFPQFNEDLSVELPPTPQCPTTKLSYSGKKKLQRSPTYSTITSSTLSNSNGSTTNITPRKSALRKSNSPSNDLSTVQFNQSNNSVYSYNNQSSSSSSSTSISSSLQRSSSFSSSCSTSSNGSSSSSSSSMDLSSPKSKSPILDRIFQKSTSLQDNILGGLHKLQRSKSMHRAEFAESEALVCNPDTSVSPMPSPYPPNVVDTNFLSTSIDQLQSFSNRQEIESGGGNTTATTSTNTAATTTNSSTQSGLSRGGWGNRGLFKSLSLSSTLTCRPTNPLSLSKSSNQTYQQFIDQNIY